jgi:hypothetical protein
VGLKNEFVGVYLKRFVIPGALVLDKPGFVDFKISGKTNIYARQIFYPEDFFVQFEKAIISKYGDEGRKKLYSIGKRFGYRFAQSGKFENISGHPGEKIKDWVFIVSKFVEGTYASLIDGKTDVSLKKTDFFLKRFTIFEKLGYDYIFAQGGTAGLMSWVFQDKSVDVVEHDVNLIDGYYEGYVMSAPNEYLKKNFGNNLILSENNLDDLVEDFDNYIKFNKQEKINCSRSFQSLVNFKFFEYVDGIVSYKENRFFLFEVSGTYLLEFDLKGDDYKGYMEILFDSAFDSGKNIFSKFGKNESEIFEVLSALGWGEVLFFSSSSKDIKIVINHFPWSKWYSKIDFIIMRGFLSGMLTAIKGRKVYCDKPVVDLSKGQLSLLFSGKYV